MRKLSKEILDQLTPEEALQLLKDGNQRFVLNLNANRNLLQQVNETRDGQHPFAVIISCMDSRTSAELIFDQGLGDIFSIRIAGNIINEDILGGTEFACKIVGAKIIVVLGHSSCSAIRGSIENLELGHLHFITSKIKRCIPYVQAKHPNCSVEDLMPLVTKENVNSSMNDIRTHSSIIKQLEHQGQIKIVGGVYNISSGKVEFF